MKLSDSTADIVAATISAWFYEPDGKPRTKESRIAFLTNALKVAASIGTTSGFTAEETDAALLAWQRTCEA